MGETIREVMKKFVNAASSMEAGKIFYQHRDLMALPEAKEAFMASIRGNEGEPLSQKILQTRWDLLDRFLDAGPEQALVNYEASVEAVLDLVNVEPGTRRIVNAGMSALLGPEADWVFADLLLQPRTDEETTRILEQWEATRSLARGERLQISPINKPVATLSGEPATQSVAAEKLNEIMALLERLEHAKGYGRTLLHLELGTLLRSCSAGNPAQNAPAAIHHLEEALAGLIGDYQADRRRAVRIELSAAYLECPDGDRVQNLNHAFEHLGIIETELVESGLVSFDPLVKEQLFRTYLNAGAANHASANHVIRRNGDAVAWRQHIEAELQAYRAAESLISGSAVDPRLAALLYCGFGNVYSILGNPKDSVAYYLAAHEAAKKANDPGMVGLIDFNLGDEFAGMQAELPNARLLSVDHLRRALAFYEPGAYPAERLQSLRRLGRLLFDMRDWTGAENALAEAVELANTGMRTATDEESQLQQVEDNVNLYSDSAYCLLRLGRIEAAVLRLEQGKLRRVAARFGHGDAGHILSELPGALPPGGAAVMFFMTRAGTAAVIVAAGTNALSAANILWFDNDRESKLHTLIFGKEGWLNSYFQFVPSGDLRWDDAIENLTAELWQMLIGPIVERLYALGVSGGAEVIVFPHGRLAILPLHCAWRSVDGLRRYALDDFAFSYAPSLRALANARHLAAQDARKGCTLLAVVNPLGDLPGALLEGEEAARIFKERGSPPPRILLGTKASPAAVMAALPQASHVLLSCHCYFHWRTPRLSALKLASGATLSLRELEQLDNCFVNCRLAVLSACESGISDVSRTPDEFTSFPATLLVQGVPGVLSALWQVDDASTAFLISRFFEYLFDTKTPMSPARALRQAQLDLFPLREEDLDRWALNVELPVGDGKQQESRDPGNADGRTFRERPFYWGALTFNGA
jgi:CHAT domain-containing protein